MNKGFIYIRENISYESNVKIGRTYNIIERNSQYITSELYPGNFIKIYEVEDCILTENMLKDNFNDLNIYKGGGTEFYKNEIIDYIEPFFKKAEISFRHVSDEEVAEMKRNPRNIDKITPRPDQAEIIDKSIEYLKINDKGILVLICGIGKTYISLWVTKQMRMKRVIIGVPNLQLLSQWEKAIKQIFPNATIKTDLNSNLDDEELFVLSTYSSIYKIKEIEFDMKILDEVHHLTSTHFIEDGRKTYINALRIKSKKQLSLTATLKVLNGNENIVSNDDIDHFGKIICERSLLWAIHNKIICDYMIQTIVGDAPGLNKVKGDINKQLYLAAFSSLKSIAENYSHHLIIYSNKIENSSKLVKYIKKILDNNLFKIDNLFYSCYTGEMKQCEQREIIANFENSKFGIICCVYCLGEGWDFPILDGVVFAEDMGSKIRIVQSALRACRRDSKNPNKKAKIILPIMNINIESNEVIRQMAAEDESIIQKIYVDKIIGNKLKYGNGYSSNVFNYDESLTKDLVLKTIQRSRFTTSYENAKKIIQNYGIESKEDYFKLCDKNIKLPHNPEIVYVKKFTNWIDYLGIKKEFYNLAECRKKVEEYLPLIKNKSPFKLHSIIVQLCEFDKMFPPCEMWIDYYKIDDISEIIKIKKRS